MKISTLAGSLRNGSYNRKLAKVAGEILKSAGIEVSEIDLKDYLLPNYDGDIEDKGIPDAAKKFADKLAEADGHVLSSPEYNFSMPGHLKNSFDWVSRIRPSPWPGKQFIFLSASPSLVGGNRGLWSLRIPFEGCGAFVYPEMFSLPSCHQAFDEVGKLKDPKVYERLEKLLAGYVAYVGKVSKSK